MLLNTFFAISDDIREISAGNYHLSVRLNPEHPVYEGHFPHIPVVPGVCTIQMIKECMEVITKKTLQYISVLNCKFTALIVPADIPELDIVLSVSEEEGTYLLKATVKKEARTFLTLKAKLKQE